MKKTLNPTRGRRVLFSMAFLAITAVCRGAAAPPPAPEKPAAPASSNPNAAVTLQDMSSIFGPGSQLQAAPDGEFNINIGEDNQLENFRAVKDVILLSKDNDLRCDEMVYDRAKGLLTATAPDKGLVYITMRNTNATPAAGAGGSQNSDTRATCGRYEYYVNEKRHVLREHPIIYQKDKQGKEAAIIGKHIEMTQDNAGRWRMNVKGDPAIVDPSRTSDLAKARAQMGAAAQPVLSIDTAAPKAPTKAGAPTKPLKIDEGNVEKLQRPKPVRVARLEEGG